MATFESSLKAKLIYVFAIPDDAHKDCLKIGETTLDEDDGSNLDNNSEVLKQSAHKRIKQYTKTAGIAYELLYVESTIFIMNHMILSFNDKQVHKVLERSGVKKKEFEAVEGADEWYCCDLETVKKAIKAVKHGENSLKPCDVSVGKNPIILRPEQRQAVDKTKKRLEKSGKMLWNAKMRFGKTIAALQLIKEQEYARTLILTHRPVVDQGWFDDFNNIFYDRDDYQYGSRAKGETFETLESKAGKGLKYVYFASMQDLRGSEQVGGKFDKNNEIFSAPWDLIIIDEAHEGTKTELGQNVIKELLKEHTKILQLSGTPFNLFDDYGEEDIYTWDYVMEQKAKMAWDVDNPYVPNPYMSLPAINIYTYDLGTLMTEGDYIEDERAFNFREFFRTKDDGTFAHDKDVDRFLDLLCKDDKDSLYPYSNEEFRRIFRHTLWVIPGVKAAKALSKKLKDHKTFGLFEVVNVAGDGDEDQESSEALKAVEKAMGADPDKTWTITLSCGRLTTGVSVKPWTGVFMLSGSFSTSAAQYMQTIFRVQTPYENHGRMKENCYAFDFAPDRTLRVLAESAKVSTKAGKQDEEDRVILGDFLNFCPIISIEGSQMKPYDVNRMMGQLKKAQIEKVVQCGFEDGALYNDELLKLTEVELHDFDDLKKTIGTTKAMAKTSDIDVNNQGFTNEQYEEKERIEKKPKKERTPEEQKKLEEYQAMSNQRKNAISILRGISIRMPLLIYGAELKNEDEEITINNFASLIDDKSWEEFMPKGVDKAKFRKFKKYYEPDVFREAGKRIREMARAADKFTIEERIERIATIFNTFRNPDKETVLTPWRVVNMHMSDCLGGWCFYDEEFKQMLATPRYVIQDKVTNEVFRPDSHILEINSKSGLYPLYVAYNIYRSRVEEAKKKYGEVGLGFSKSLWDATIEENILVVCKTPMAKSITKRTLAGFRDTKVNAQYYPNLVENISERPEAVVNTFRDGKHFWKINNNTNMKLDAIVGNPPYQLTGGSGGSNDSSIYQEFCLLGFDLRPDYASFIIPSRWFSAGRESLIGTFRSRMLTCGNIAYMKNNTNGRYFFPTVELKGGVCYFRYEKNYKGKCNYTYVNHGETVVDEIDMNRLCLLVRDPRIADIVEKVYKKIREDGNTTVDTIISGDTPFGIPTNPSGSTKTPFNVYSSKNEKHDVIVYYIEKNKRKVAYVSKSDIKKNSADIDKPKVFMPKASGSGNDPYVLGETIIAPKNSVCSQTFVYSAFTTDDIAKNFNSYLKTKFVRILVASIKITQDCLSGVFRFVPLLDFSKPWTDAELYAKYGLTEDEIAFIESMIKPME